MGSKYLRIERETYGVKHEVVDDDPTASGGRQRETSRKCQGIRRSSLRTAVEPPVPHPVESYIVATNCRPDGSTRLNV